MKNVFMTEENDEINFATAEGDLDTIKRLLKDGSKIPKDMIIYAASNNRYNITNWLIKRGVDINVKKGRSLYQSLTNGHHKIVELLVNNGASKELLFTRMLTSITAFEGKRRVKYLAKIFNTKQIKDMFEKEYLELKKYT